MSLVTKGLGLVQNLISLGSFAVLLARFSPWALLILMVGMLPMFFAETHFSGNAFRLLHRRAPETHQQNYLDPCSPTNPMPRR